jgi:hypothetical protein
MKSTCDGCIAVPNCGRVWVTPNKPPLTPTRDQSWKFCAASMRVSLLQLSRLKCSEKLWKLKVAGEYNKRARDMTQRGAGPRSPNCSCDTFLLSFFPHSFSLSLSLILFLYSHLSLFLRSLTFPLSPSLCTLHFTLPLFRSSSFLLCISFYVLPLFVLFTSFFQTYCSFSLFLPFFFSSVSLFFGLLSNFLSRA